MRKETKNWLDTAKYDITTAQHMLNTGRYIYVIFMCHLAIEKILKAVINEKTGKLPPKTHSLLYLLELSKVKLSEDLLDFVGALNNASIVTRYPEDLKRLISNYRKGIAQEYLKKTGRIIRCIKKDPRLAQ